MRTRTAAQPPVRLAALLAAGLMVLGLAACGDDDATDSDSDQVTTTTAPDEGGAAEEATITAADFSLTSVTAKAGEDVYLDNTGEKPHTVTADDGSFDTGTVQPGKEGEFTAPSEPGTYAYHCSIHATMTGTLTVEAA